MNTLVIDIGGSKFTVAEIGPAGDGVQIVRRHRQATDREGGRAWLLKELDRVLQSWLTEPNPIMVERVGISFGGPVDFKRQKVALSTHVAGWEDFSFADWFSGVADRAGFRTTSLSVAMDNDANCGALGEAYLGIGRVPGTGEAVNRPLFYVTLSTGIGGGLVLEDGSVYRGADSWAGELGHIQLDPNGPKCLCGANGCFERMCSGMWLEHDHGEPAQALLSDDVFLARYAAMVARGLKPLIMLLNPSSVVVGGGVAKTGPRLFDRLNHELRREMTGWSGARVNVVPGALGDDSVLWGAFVLAVTWPWITVSVSR